MPPPGVDTGVDADVQKGRVVTTTEPSSSSTQTAGEHNGKNRPNANRAVAYLGPGRGVPLPADGAVISSSCLLRIFRP